MERSFEAVDIPATEDNMTEGLKAFEQVKELEALSEGAMKYMLDNHLNPSIENIYFAEFSGSASYVKPNEEIDFEALRDQMEQVITAAGGIVRYGVDRRSFYELTLDGQAFVQKKEKQKSECAYFDRIFEEIGQEDKWEMGLSDPEDEFMNCVENTYWPEKFLYGNREKLALQKILT